MNAVRVGYLCGLGAYVFWGFVPLYFRLLLPSQPAEILAHRVIWSVLFVALLLIVLRRGAVLRDLRRKPRAMAGIIGAAVLIGVNWFTYIYAVNSDRVVETALGYFINPLVVILLGVCVLGERLRVAQWVALGIGGVAVVVLTVGYGRLPYIALALALTFGCYGLIKKQLGLPAAEGLLVESLVLALPAIGYLGWLAWRSEATFGQVSVGHTALLMFAGVATAVPLLLFAEAANRIPLTALGVLQYTAPILQFGIGVVILHEPMPPARLAGFALVWLALIVFTSDAIRHARRPVQRLPDDVSVATSAR